MKKVLVAYGALVVVVIILAFAKFNGSVVFLNFGAKPTATIGSQKFTLEVVKDEKSRQLGLSNRKSLDEKSGMLFVFDKKDKYSFWMKSTLIPLDIIFIDKDKIVFIAKNARPESEVKGILPIYMTPIPADLVIEINGGLSDKYKFKTGDKVSFTGVK